MDTEEGQLAVLQHLEQLIEKHVQDFSPYVLSDLEEKAKVNNVQYLGDDEPLFTSFVTFKDPNISIFIPFFLYHLQWLLS